MRVTLSLLFMLSVAMIIGSVMIVREKQKNGTNVLIFWFVVMSILAGFIFG